MKYQDFSFYWKIISSSRAPSFTREDIAVAMVTNMISQWQESFPLRRAAGSFEISFTKWLRDCTVTGDFLDEPRIHNMMLF